MDVREQLQRDEGLRLKPYVDTVGKTSIGYGRNLTDVGISEYEALVLLDNDIDNTRLVLGNRLPWFHALDEVRQGVFINLTFNLGFNGLEKFPKMLAAAAQGDWIEASQELMNSAWRQQVGDRALRLAKQMITGTWV